MHFYDIAVDAHATLPLANTRMCQCAMWNFSGARSNFDQMLFRMSAVAPMGASRT